MNPTNQAPAATPVHAAFPFNIEDLEVGSKSRLVEIEVKQREMDLLYARAAMYAASSIVPEAFRKNEPNCAIAINIADRMGLDTLLVMQSLYVVHGKPSWSAQFLIAAFNSGRQWGPIHYEVTGAPGTDEHGYTAVAISKDKSEKIEGPKVTWRMVKGEGWLDKTGSKWKTMPEVMFRYRSAAFLIRTVSPEIALGFPTVEEVIDVGELDIVPAGPLPSERGLAGKIDARIAKSKEKAAKPPVESEELPITAEERKEAETIIADADPVVVVKDAQQEEDAPLSGPPSMTLLKKINQMEAVVTTAGFLKVLNNHGYLQTAQISNEAKANDILGELRELGKQGK